MAARYGIPGPEVSWGEFVIMARRCGRFDARDYLRAMDGPMLAVPSDTPGPRILLRQELAKAAGYE